MGPLISFIVKTTYGNKSKQERHYDIVQTVRHHTNDFSQLAYFYFLHVYLPKLMAIY